MFPIECMLKDIHKGNDILNIAIITVKRIWEERDDIFYTQSIELLKYIHDQCPKIEPENYHHLIANLKMKVH